MPTDACAHTHIEVHASLTPTSDELSPTVDANRCRNGSIITDMHSNTGALGHLVASVFYTPAKTKNMCVRGRERERERERYILMMCNNIPSGLMYVTTSII